MEGPDVYIDGFSIKAVFELVNSGGLRLETLLRETRSVTLAVASCFVCLRNGSDWRLCNDADRENHLREELFRERAGHYDTDSESESIETDSQQEDTN